ncbi:hypothetical protein [Sphingomonas sp. G-3-2-10]|uniref:hypothetical protein n=1 Tax=Sphingomonas sp. G-3-2-10 TaxID=2728838 RepID=UPI00146CBD8B|nr:hypothetical protein [Sphingomonas sp. G-3-2-10]NML07486.1 hypothetical protein [Sphingomonas sp. G-3-2-10]
MKAILLGLIASVAICGPALAQSRTVSFEVGGVAFTPPMPEGYCPATAAQQPLDQYAATLDKDNLTSITLHSCGASANMLDYIIIKTPHAVAGTAVTRAQVLESLGPDFDSKDGKPFNLEDTETMLSGALAETTGKKAEVSLDLRPRGKDDVCGYFGGFNVTTPAGGKKIEMTVGSCITAVDGRVLVLNFYAAGNDPATLAALLRRSRAFALTLRGKPRG